MLTKICVICNIEKSLDKENFYIRSDSKKWCNKCKECTNELKKLYYLSNKEHYSKSFKDYYEKNKEEILNKKNKYYKLNKKQKQDYNQKYRIENKEKINQQRKKYRERIKFEPHYKCSTIIRVLKSKIKVHSEDILNSLGYNLDDLKIHLESQFESWMNWNNHGKYEIDKWNNDDPLTWKWNIDHIIPKSRFEFNSVHDEQFKKCWSLNNLQPLSAKDNVSKRNKDYSEWLLTKIIE